MFQRVLIANRGEIALRGIKACRNLGIKTMGIYSDPDRDSLHVREADISLPLFGSTSADTYLNIEKILNAAKKSDSDAIFPGYGFLSENADFAEACEKEGIVFIGPTSEAIRKMGNKIEARALMKSAGVPVKPGSDGPVKSLEEAVAIGQEAGYPLMIKTARGGGGKGIRVVRDETELERGFVDSSREAQNSFGGNNAVFIEKYFEGGKHIEVQVLGDSFGNVIHLGERECSVQRRYQKLIEEAPAPNLDQDLRKKIHEIGVKAAKAVNYRGAGTVEMMLFDTDSRPKVYFIEMNTRIQVEHGITEMITGVDIAQEMIKVAAGERLSYSQRDISFKGHAIECRVNCEDPYNDFMPSPGRITRLKVPEGPGIRFDTHIYTGYQIPFQYDSLVGKLMVHEKDRENCIAKIEDSLEGLAIEGVQTTIPIHSILLKDSDFKRGTYDTNLIPHVLHEKSLESQPVIRNGGVNYSVLGSQGCYLRETLVGQV